MGAGPSRAVPLGSFAELKHADGGVLCRNRASASLSASFGEDAAVEDPEQRPRQPRKRAGDRRWSSPPPFRLL
jgi:hypothetical protein